MAIEQNLDELEEKSVFILREAKSRFKKVGVLWSTGKDSTTMVQLMRKAFFGKVPFTLIHLDNKLDFPETYAFRKTLAEDWNLDVLVGDMDVKKEDENISGVSCCGVNKAESLKKLVDEH
ncbi:MAG: phosphoadenosine phosphosulfate reductase family protein, partial [Candidatus Micrarchaeota archaeon]|nr:phosphoadenosine phosphosulfate reductase family protein [Candidatus Micrarchaeota archaeon]